MTNLKRLNGAQEVIGQAIHDFMGLSSDNPEDKKAIEDVNFLLETAFNSYTLVKWSEVQVYMKEDWFKEEAYLSNNSSYFIPNQRL